ncbi:MAG: SDR family NAD(P)-dependent oxidoreductase, partial [Alphaproteobacteria bacterium]
MDLKLSGKKALITGASKGIGKATAKALASEGCDLILVSRTERDLLNVKSTIGETSSTKICIEALDLSVSGTSEQLAKSHPEIDILVNNAGAIPGGSLEEINEEQWRSAWDLKVFGYINMCRSFYRKMKLRNSGTIVNIIGNAGDTRDP